MPLSAGTSLGPYEVLAPAGAGGMGEVYRARDTRLDRIVALKVLPTHLATDAALRERFEREARAISHLNHPNICTLHDVGSDQGTDFLVMEYLEGESLADRVARGAVPVALALQIAVQVAEALQRAHQSALVHRDLKPSNIFLVSSGSASSAPLVKLLDFGLAKSGSPVASINTASPTLAQALTGQGTILGTLQYMAPEQLEGREADARADIFAFGAVLYEMLTGKRAFDGNSQASVIASILSIDPPPISSQRPVTPAILDHLVSRALAKDPADRWASIHDVLLQLRWISTHGLELTSQPQSLTTGNRQRRWWVAASAALLIGLSIAVAMLMRDRAAVAPAPIHFELYPPEGDTFMAAGFATIYMTPALSHDGTRMIVPAIGADGVRRLWLRRLDAADPQLLAGTNNGFLPFWSPDDRSIGFFADGKLLRLDLEDGTARALAEVAAGLGGTWNREGTIVFAPSASSVLHRISASGGAAQRITSLDTASAQVSHRFPSFLPDGRHVVFLARSTKPDTSGIFVVSLESGATVKVMASPNRAMFALPGWLLFQSGMASDSVGGLYVHRFDPERRELSGQPIVLRQNIMIDEAGHGSFTASQRGTLAFRTLPQGRDDTLNWYTRTGSLESAVSEPGDYTVPRLSPNGRRLALSRSGSIWIRDLTRGTFTRLTTGGGHCCPVWSPDGLQIAFRRGPQDLAIKLASGTVPEQVVLANGMSNTPTQWAPDGKGILFQTFAANRIDTGLLPLDEPRTPKPILQSPFNDEQAQLSPDSRWIAFTSDESGHPEVYVQDYPGLSDKWQISTNGGADPQWRADGAELFFIAPDLKMMAVAIKAGPKFEPGIPAPLFQTRVTGLTDVRTHYQVAADGQRFLVNTIGPADRGAPIQVIVNWPAALGR